MSAILPCCGLYGGMILFLIWLEWKDKKDARKRKENEDEATR